MSYGSKLVIKDREKEGQQFQETYKFKDETWKLADNFLYRKQGVIKQVDDSEVFIFSRDKETIINADFIYQNFANIWQEIKSMRE